MSNSYARLRLRVRGLRITNAVPRNPHVQVRVGHQVYVGPKRTPDAPWDDTFYFDLSLHEHLFWTAQIDVYDSRTLLPRSHLGRSEIRLYKLEHQLHPELRWFDLRNKYHCYVNLSELGVRDPVLQENIVGSILLELQYRTVKTKRTSSNLQGNLDGSPPPTIDINKGGRFGRSSSLPSLLPSMMLDCLKEEDSERKKKKHHVKKQAKNPGQSLPASPNLRPEIDDILETQTEISESREINSLLKRITGWVFSNDDHLVVQNILKGLAGFGQGIEVGPWALTLAYLVLQRFYRIQPIVFSNNIVLRKEDLEIPRVIFRYAYAAHGWAAMCFFGKRNEIFSDAISSTANYRAVLEYLQLDPNDLLVCDLDEDRLFRPNFYVAIDRRLSAVILSIRGTMSLRDTLTDLSFEYVSWNGGLAHSGMLAAATWFMENIARQLCMFAEEYQMQRIIITGHSLGGATASLTTIMLTEELLGKGLWPKTVDGKPIDIHCYSFGTPAVLSPDLALKYLDLVDSFIFGDDIVPRLSYGTVTDLQILMVYAGEICGASDLLGNLEGSGLFQKLETCRNAIQNGTDIVNPKLCIPGKVHHIITLKAPNNRKYTVVDTCEPKRFWEVALRKNMIIDHLPNRYEQAFDEAYVTYLMHELDERKNIPGVGQLSMKDKMAIVVELVNSTETSPNLTETTFFPCHVEGEQ